MENKANSKSIILNYGLILGAIGTFIHLALWASGQLIELNWINSVAWFVSLIVLLVLAIKKYKESTGGYISWGQGLKIGMGVAMVSGVISVIYTLLFMNVIDPEFQQRAMEVQQQAWLDGGLTQDQIDTFTESAKKFQSPGIITALILGMSAFFGFIVSAITAAVMKKSEEEQY